jgi:hypothetical protein
METDEYTNLVNTFNTYSISELLDLCEKHNLKIYGNREMIIDRLSHYFSEGRRKNSIKYKIKECYNSIHKIFCSYTFI